jgi:hypothetical protein
VKPRSLVHTYSTNILIKSILPLLLGQKMEAAVFSETMVQAYHKTRHHILVVCNLHIHYCKNFKSHTGRNLEGWKSLTRVYDKCTFALYLCTHHECEDGVPRNWRPLPATMLRTCILRETQMLRETKISQTRLLTIYTVIPRLTSGPNKFFG